VLTKIIHTFLRRSDSTPTGTPLTSQGWYWWFRSLKKLALLCFLLLTTDKRFLTPSFSLYFASSCFSYKISFPTATLNIASNFSFQCFWSLQKLIHLFAPPPPAVLGFPFCIVFPVTRLLCYAAINLILLLCSPALHLNMVFLCSLQMFWGKTWNLCIKLWR